MRVLLLLLSCIFAGCASSYKPLRPDTVNYTNKIENEGVGFAYRHGVLRENGNKKYAKREDRKAIRLVSIKITNNLQQPIVVGNDVMIYAGDSQLALIEPKMLHRELKQGVPEYLLFLLLTPLQLTVGQESTPIGLVLGPGIAFGNMIGAGSANQNFLEELEKFNVLNKTINPGETVYGIIGIRDIGYNAITLKLAD